LAEDALEMGLAMLIRGEMVRVLGGAADAAAIPSSAATLPTLLLGGLLLLIGP
jgi:hypothetical protein